MCCIIFSFMHIDIFVSYKHEKISQHVREFLIVCNRSCFPSVLKCSKYDHIQNFMTNVQKNQCPFQVWELMVIEKCSNNLSQYLVDQTTILMSKNYSCHHKKHTPLFLSGPLLKFFLFCNEKFTQFCF